MSTSNGFGPPPPPYSFVGSSRLSPPQSVCTSPPAYHAGLSLGYGGSSPSQLPNPLLSGGFPGVLQNIRPPVQQPPSMTTDDQFLYQNEATAVQRPELELRPEDVVVPIMGMIGAGKSTFVSLFADCQNAALGHKLKGSTRDVEVYPYQVDRKTRVLLVDTPGFTGTNRSDINTLRSVANFFCLTFSNNVKTAGVIYLHDITAKRMDGAAKRNLRMLRKLCGATNLSKVIMTTNKWGNLGEFHDGVSREKQLRDCYWRSMLSRGSTAMRHTGSRRSAEQIVKALLHKRQPIVLDIQREMVLYNQQLSNTAAGRELYADMEMEKQRYAGELVALGQEFDEALRQKDSEYGRALRGTKTQLQEKIKLLEERMRALRMDFHRLKPETNERELGRKKKNFGRTALGIGVGAILGLTTGIFI
ncbi:uncharacterized protein PADG_01125 [Paracoccidioides brasiliensis Pb18]|uniref:G domain-containing protein n=1 Tax=Paracoccidioides brasiliensis (strain Pb18) TaxID=502780 RepID=C1FZ99_PARBD|nr:uncharacterized protein PADG_01125 [Paracoccidioides brasiliensis Pb18]EEH44836.1 hypothetical protein PADG_01125 [Paracoccidioides brasiliensis Pb18]